MSVAPPPSNPEPWLRGPLPGIPEPLQPVAHALVAAGEDITAAVADLTPSQIWTQPGGAPSIGFHLLHLAGSTDRLFTYARGERLSERQRAALDEEQRLPEPRPSADDLLRACRATFDRAMRQLEQTPEATLSHQRLVGRARLPSTVRGLLFHGAEHAERHVGQVITTAKIIRGGTSMGPDRVGDAKRFIGTWRLVSLTGNDGAPEPVRGPHPAGMIHYDRTGHMSVQIMPDRPRPLFTGLYPTPDEALGAVAGYTAYFGTYSINEQTRTVTHHREGNIRPGGVGDFVRRYEFLSDDTVAFTPEETGNPIGRLVWERIRAEPTSEPQ